MESPKPWVLIAAVLLCGLLLSFQLHELQGFLHLRSWSGNVAGRETSSRAQEWALI